MKDLLLSLGLMTLARVHGQSNNTMAPTGEPTMEPTPSVTELYTSEVILDTQYTINDSNLSNPRDIGCDYEWMATLDDGEGIVIDLCGFTNDAGEAKIDIELIIPSDRWFGVGFTTPEDYVADDEMRNVYALIVPQNSRDISERFLGGDDADVQTGDKLIGIVSVADDYTEMGMRTLRLQRDETKNGDSLNLNYFNFENFNECAEEMRVIWGFAPLANEAFENDADWFESENSGSMEATMEEVDGQSCAEESEEGDGVEGMSVAMVAGVVSVVAAMM